MPIIQAITAVLVSDQNIQGHIMVTGEFLVKISIFPPESYGMGSPYHTTPSSCFMSKDDEGADAAGEIPLLHLLVKAPDPSRLGVREGKGTSTTNSCSRLLTLSVLDLMAI